MDKLDKEFKPPKLPIDGILSIFTIPLFIAAAPLIVQPIVFDGKTWIIIALSVISITLAVANYRSTLRAYDNAFKEQLTNIHRELLIEEAKILHNEQDKLREEIKLLDERLTKQAQIHRTVNNNNTN